MRRFVFNRDDSTGILRISTHGTWEEGDGRAFAAEYRRQFDAAREQFGVVRVLLDGRDTRGHPDEVNRHYRKVLIDTLADPADRLAVITIDSLVKMDVHKALRCPQFQAFLSTNAAETWLRAHQ